MFRPASSKSSLPRQKTQVNPRLDKSLTTYMVAASTAGVTMLAMSGPAQAKVVYTPDDQQIKPNIGLSLDLTNNGIADFVFSNFYSSTSSILALSIGPVNPSNEIFSTGANRLSVFAAAIPAGVVIGPNGKFKKRRGEGMANGEDIQGVCQGPWVHAQDEYLGLKFVINAEVHFGWARLNVNCDYPHAIQAMLTGYAYETVANKPIIAGETSGPDVASAVDPEEMFIPFDRTARLRSATLGVLARGADALAIWRRDEEAVLLTA